MATERDQTDNIRGFLNACKLSANGQYLVMDRINKEYGSNIEMIFTSLLSHEFFNCTKLRNLQQQLEFASFAKEQIEHVSRIMTKTLMYRI